MSDLIISLSGLRGIVDKSLTEEVAAEFAKAYATVLGQKKTLVVGGDTRQSFQRFKEAIIDAIQSCGLNVIDIGQCPTPTVQQAIRHHQADGGLVITASHNPIMWNGIKLMNSEGAFLVGEAYDKTLENYQHKTFKEVATSQRGTVSQDNHAIDTHIDRILAHFDISSIQESPLRVLVDVNHGTGAIADPLLFNRLGVAYDIMYPEADGNFSHTPEPIKENLSAICQRLKKGGFDIGFVQDPDADRLVIIAGDGTFIGEDYSLAYCMDYLLGHETAKDKQVVVNLSTSKVIDYICDKHQATLTHSKIGEPNVVAGLKAKQAQVGGEGNGGVIYPKVGWGRDSLLGIVVALKHLAESKMSVIETVKTYPRFILKRDKIQLCKKEEVEIFLETINRHFATESINTQDGVKIDFGQEWLHVRPSNTEPIVRLFAESTSSEKADALIEKAKALQ